MAHNERRSLHPISLILMPKIKGEVYLQSSNTINYPQYTYPVPHTHSKIIVDPEG